MTKLLAPKDLQWFKIEQDELSPLQLQTMTQMTRLLEEFFLDMPRNTAKAYHSDLRGFYNFTVTSFGVPRLELGLKSLAKIERFHVVKYKAQLAKEGGLGGKPAAPLTIIRKLAAIKVWYDFLIEKDLAAINPAHSVRRPRAQVQQETEALSDQEVAKLFRAIDKSDSKASPLHKAVVAVMFSTGIRSIELRNLRFKNYKEREGISYLEYTGKGGKKNKVALHPLAVKQLSAYIAWMQQINRPFKPESYLFQPTLNRTTGNISKALSSSGLRYIVDHYIALLGLNKRITPHSSRATVISSLLESGEDLYRVSLAVDHADPRTTKKYDKRGKKLKDSPFLKLNYFNED